MSQPDGPQAHAPPSDGYGRPLMRLFPVLVLNVVELGIALPVLPALALALDGDAIDVGLLYAIQSLGQFVMAPAWGALSDRFGRKPMIVLILLLAAGAELLTAVAPSLVWLYAARLLVGLCAGSIATASALIADVTDAGTRSKGMALVGISFGIGFTIGPAAGAGLGIIADDGAGLMGSGLPFAVAGLLSLGNAAFAALVLVEPADSSRARASNRIHVGLAAIRHVLRSKHVAGLCLLFFAYTIAASVMESTFFLFMEDRYGYDERHVGAIFAGLGLLMAAVQGGVGRISEKIGDRRMTIIGGVVVGLGLAAAPVFEELACLLTLLGIATAGRALIHPGILALTSKTDVGEENTGRVMGVLQSSSSLGRIAGPAAGGWIFAAVSPEAPFYVAGAVMIFAISVWSVRRGS